MKKLLIVFLVVTILSGYIMPVTTFAASTAEVLANAILKSNANAWYGVREGSEEKAQNIIDSIIAADKNKNSVTVRNDEETVIIKATEVDDVQKAFEQELEESAPGMGQSVVSGAHDLIQVEEIVSQENNKENNNQKPAGNTVPGPATIPNSSFDIDTEAKEMSEILTNKGGMAVWSSLVSKGSCKKVINAFLYSNDSNPEDKMFCDNGIIYIETTNPTFLQDTIENYAGENNIAVADRFVNDQAEYGSFIKITKKNVEVSADATPEEKIKIWLQNKYSLSPGELTAILEEEERTITYYDYNKTKIQIIEDYTIGRQKMKYKATFDEEQNVTNVLLGEDYLRDIGVDDITLGNIEDEQNPPGAKADLGGILLSPIFYLVNFVADAIISNLGGIMDPVAGSGITRNSYFARRFSCSD